MCALGSFRCVCGRMLRAASCILRRFASSTCRAVEFSESHSTTPKVVEVAARAPRPLPACDVCADGDGRVVYVCRACLRRVHVALAPDEKAGRE